MNDLLIDVGSTFIKYAVNTPSGGLVCSGKLPFPPALVDDGVRYLVSSSAITDAVDEILGQMEKYHVKCCYMSVQMHGYVLRRAEGSVSEYVSWRDHSGDVTQSWLRDVDFDALGTACKDNLPLVKLSPRTQAAEFYTLGSYIVWHLTGVNATHITDACASGFFDAQSGAYCRALEQVAMPTVHRKLEPVGFWRDIAVYPPVGDHQVSVLGSGVGEEAYLVNIGTATQISCVAQAGQAGACEKRPWFTPERRLYTVSGLVGGDRLFRGAGKELLPEQILEAVRILPSKGKMLFGGGGSAQVFEELNEVLARHGIDCALVEKNIGIEGMKMLASQEKIQLGVMHSEIPFQNFPLIAKNAGLDFVILDDEHGAFDYSTLSGIIMNANLVGLRLIVRVGDAGRAHVTKLADMGAHGFLMPMTDTPEQARQLVRCAKHSPLGRRGISTTRAHTMYAPPPLAEYKTAANEKMELYAQIETRTGVENVDAILAVEGISGVLIGPNDLSDDLGVSAGDAQVLTCVDAVAAAAERAGKPWGIITANQKLLDYARSRNVNMISCGSELNMLINGCKKVREML